MEARTRLPIFHSTIRTVSYKTASDDDTHHESCAIIASSAMFELGKPKPRGVFDSNMGTTDSSYNCATCQLNKEMCHGHPGNFDLKYPCLSPIAMLEIKKWLKIICFECGNIILSPEEMQAILGHIRQSERLDYLVKHMQNQIRKCVVCGRPHPIVKRPEKGKYIFAVKDITADGTSVDIPLYPHNIEEIFARIRTETVIALGRNPQSHPRSFVWRTLYIPPPAIRPDTKKSGGRGESGNDSITSRLKEFIHMHTVDIPTSIPPAIDPKTAAAINKLNELLADILTKGSDNSKSIAMRLKGKHGRIRDNLLGKRVFGMGRSTIDGSPRLNLDQISIPLFIAQTLQIEEVIQDFNRERLMPFIANGKNRYPGCSCIIKPSGDRFLPDSPILKIENGDTIVRDLVNGDYVAYNRQPTLTLSNITSVRVVVDKTALANGMSVLICPFFNADFDGDQMNVFNYAKQASLNEQIMMTRVASRMVSSTTGAMTIGQSGDSMIGLAKLTQSGVFFNRYHAGLIFGSTICAPHFEEAFASAGDKGLISGREIVSMTLAQAPINFRGRSVYYDQGAPWMKWMIRSPYDAPRRTDDSVVEIVGGRLLRGCLDKPNIGAGARSIYQVMVHEFGQLRTLDVIFDMQQAGINYISQHGFTTGVHDFSIDPAEREKIVRGAQGLLTKAHQITRNLDHGRIIPPVDKTIQQFYEEQQIAALRVFDDFHEPIIRSIKHPRANGIFELMASGSKGEIIFMCNMSSVVGLILLGGERIRPNFGFARTLPYFQRFEETPEARGYVGTSFMQGLSSIGCIFNAMLARTDIISRALMTSQTGDQNRKSIKSLESIVTNNYRMTVKGREVVSFVYGGDYFDPRSLETVTYGPAFLSNADFAARYRTEAANPSNAAIFNEEWAAIGRDREEYRRIFKRVENLSVRDKMSADVKLPFNIERLVERLAFAIRREGATGGTSDKRAKAAAKAATAAATAAAVADDPSVEVNIKRAVRAFEAQSATSAASAPASNADSDYIKVIEMVRKFCDDVPYLFINEDQRRVHGWVPEFISSAATIMRMYIHAELSIARLRAMPYVREFALVPFVTGLLEGITAIVTTSLIDPGQAVGIIAAQSFSEPLTQMMLDAYKLSALGHPTKPKMSKCREIMNAYDVHRLSNPMMTIVLDDEHATSAERAQEVAQQIEMLTFGQLVHSSQIFYERYGEPIHPQYAHESAIFETFAADNPLLAVPGDLVSWCMRFEIDKNMLVQKNISMAEIVTQLRDKYSDLYLVYTTERADRAIIRAYIRAAGLVRFSASAGSQDAEGPATSGHGKKQVKRGSRGDQGLKIQEAYKTILGTIIHGINGIAIAKVEKLVRTRIDEGGAIVDDMARYGIRTRGTNLARVACIPGVRADLTFSDAIQELAATLGIEAARYRIVVEMRGIVDKCNVRHYMVYADEMTRTGRVTAIERGGLSLREANNVALRAGHAAPVQIFTEAALNNRRDTLSGVSGPLTFGTVPRIGTLYNAFMVDPDIIKKYKKSAAQILEDI